MKIIYFTHSLASCWNHGNAHFVRGVLRELMALGHEVTALEAKGSWSLTNLLGDHGVAGLDAFRRAYPGLRATFYDAQDDIGRLVADADLVLVHEWNTPSLIAELARLRKKGARFTLLFHDTHHRAVSDPEAIRTFALDGFDGILAFGATLADIYRRWGWGDRVWVWHEAADLRLFRPPSTPGPRQGLVWIGNWGDGERTAELETFLFRPARVTGLALDVHGVRYPPEALDMMRRYGANYRGWIANALVPEIFARHMATVHVPRSYYASLLPGIPTIRMFEALACGIPLVSAPWDDVEGLFRRGEDYLVARDGAEMTQQLRALRDDPARAAALAASGLETVRSRHGCQHRADQLLQIVASLTGEQRRMSA